MHVPLTPEQEHQIRLKVGSGPCNNASEAARESLRMMLERLKDELGVGIDQLKRGEGVTITDRNDFMTKARGGR